MDHSLSVMAGTTILLCILLWVGVNGSSLIPFMLFFRLLVRLLDALLLLSESTEMQGRSVSDALPSARGNWKGGIGTGGGDGNRLIGK
jgi:hypothetical protein